MPQEQSHPLLNLVQKRNQHHLATAESTSTSILTIQTAHYLLTYLFPKQGKTQGWGPMRGHGCSTLRLKDLEWRSYNRKTSKICRKGWGQHSAHVFGGTKAMHQVLLTAWRRALPWPPTTLFRNAISFFPLKSRVNSALLPALLAKGRMLLCSNGGWQRRAIKISVTVTPLCRKNQTIWYFQAPDTFYSSSPAF